MQGVRDRIPPSYSGGTRGLERTSGTAGGRDGAAPGAGRVLYLQLNNPKNRRLVEADDLAAVVARDPAHPKLDTVNFTSKFNTHGDEAKATQAFKAKMREYMDALITLGQPMTGFVVSGHSDGTHMLEEVAPHDYESNLEIRKALQELRNESPRYRKLMDGCEKVALLACFGGSHAEEWAAVFPNATIAGTDGYAPLSSSHSSGAIPKAAWKAHEKLRAGLSPPDAARAGYRVGSKPKDLVIRTPGVDLARLEAALDKARKEYETIDVAGILAARGKGFTKPDLDRAYAAANRFHSASLSLWVASGRPGGDGGDEMLEIRRLDAERQQLFSLRQHGAR